MDDLTLSLHSKEPQDRSVISFCCRTRN